MSAERSPAGAGGVLRTRDLASLAGVTPRALRHYHRIGLLTEAPRDPNGYRRYSAADLVRVLRIRELAASGMPLREVARALDHDPSNLSAQLEELERGLAAQAEHIDRQRALLGELRRSLLGSGVGSVGTGAGREPGADPTTDHPPLSATAQLDRDVWLLTTGTGAIDAATAAQFEHAIADQFGTDGAPAWLAEFEALEGIDVIDDSRADRIAEAISEFALAISAAHEFGEPENGPQILGLVEDLQSSTLSQAQQEVWRRFQASFAREPALHATRQPTTPESDAAGHESSGPARSSE